MRKSIIFTLIVVIGFYLTGYAFADDKALESEIYYDKNTGLEWLAGPDKPTNWNEAKKWVRSLADISDGGWRMPTIEMLKTLYNMAGKCNIKPFLKALDVGYGLEKPRIPLRLGAMTTLTHAVDLPPVFVPPFKLEFDQYFPLKTINKKDRSVKSL